MGFDTILPIEDTVREEAASARVGPPGKSGRMSLEDRPVDASDRPIPPSLRVSVDDGVLQAARLDRQPALTAHALIRHAVAWSEHPLPSRLRAELLNALGPESRVAYDVLAGPGPSYCPSGAVPAIAGGPQWAHRAAAAVADADGARVREELTGVFGPRLPERYDVVAQDPTRWLRAMSAGLRETAPIVEQFWRRAGPRLDAETTRMDIAMRAPDAVRALANSVSAHVSVTGSELRVIAKHDVPVPLVGRLVFVPLVAPPGVRLLIKHGNDLRAGYALAPSGATWHDLPRSHRQLHSLLGETRAALLLALDCSKHMGQLAVELRYSPSTLTHHAHRLVDAGLVTSERLGKKVVLHRTPKGHVLIDLLAE